MKTNNKFCFILSSISYLIVSFLDLYLTYLATPNLELEGNPLYNVVFFSWKGLIAINVVSYIIYVLMAYFAFVAYKRPVTSETDIKKYLSYISYGDSEKYSVMMWRLPKYWAPQIACLCWSVAVILPFARLLIVFVWFVMLLDINAVHFMKLVSLMPMGRIDLVFAILGAWALSFVWVFKEFRLNLKNIKEGKQNDE